MLRVLLEWRATGEPAVLIGVAAPVRMVDDKFVLAFLCANQNAAAIFLTEAGAAGWPWIIDVVDVVGGACGEPGLFPCRSDHAARIANCILASCRSGAFQAERHLGQLVAE